jgi:hypothetical protein
VLAWIDGHPDLSDTLLLIAAVAFVLGMAGRMMSAREGRPSIPGWFLELGLALVAVALLVL